MDNITEIHQRKIKLLYNDNLSNSIKNMIKVKGLPAELDSVTTIADSEGKTEIVVRLYVNRASTGQRAKVYLYITEDIFYLNKEKSFERIDFEIGPRANGLSNDSLIKLRALRVVSNAINNLSATDGPSGVVYVRTRQDGLCDYS